LTNKAAKGKKGTIVAMIAGTKPILVISLKNTAQTTKYSF
jgi:hypothetical protein